MGKLALLQSMLYQYWQENPKLVHNRQVYAKLAGVERQMIRILQAEDIHSNIHSLFNVTVFVARLLGFTFVTQWLMRKKERRIRRLSVSNDGLSLEKIGEIRSLVASEKELIGQLKESRLDFVGAIILGMNDALVEITGSVAGFTLSMSNSMMIAIAGLIAGIAASLSMGASEFMAERSEGNIKKAATAAIYTGFSYIFTVVLLVLPFFLVPNNQYILALLITVMISVSIIFIFSYYMDVAKKIGFKQRFWEMAIICLGVSALTFFIGFVVKTYFGVGA
ncbi:VIT1/CCC1 transporter family protein [Sporolactobacillus sp. CQH2019]|uniref:VIT1/CCC1 transporter family protein n=1 Tax=Sporolactobacillus sp. CQH2019 TaxID=3023512 RepID=UPI002367AEB3|nr:VIT1/CCC1 transporter family protein [Sporolactobacillus sp. CQH2019]